VFFVISGVVIGRSLDSQRRARAIGGEFVPFMIRRVLRLYPAHIVAIAGIIGLAALFLMGRPPIDFAGAYPDSIVAHRPDEADWLNGTVFTPLKWKSVVGNLAMASWSLNAVVWSLYAEICAAPFLPLFHRLARCASAWLDVSTLAALIALLLFNWAQVWSRYLFVFYLGMMVETRGLDWARLIERTLGGSRRAVALSYLVLVLPNIYAADRSVPIILVEAFAAFSIISLIVLSEGRASLRSLEQPALRWNGRLSYSFYLWHFVIMTIAVRPLYTMLAADVLHRAQIPIFLLLSVITIGLALGVAQLSYSYVEVPSIALGRTMVALWRQLSLGRTGAARPSRSTTPPSR
jgi:peptidoglycan/LPS O-acetylase OafA/YrhL